MARPGVTSPVSSSGFLRVDKPIGPTSHDVVRIARRALSERRVGHAGTLDPFASGLLLLGVGPATRLTEYLGDLDKSYEAVARLGTVTSTLDPEGEVVATSEDWRDVTEARLLDALESLTGSVDQLPPSYSAKKVDGERAYRKARRGETVELTPARITIHELELLSWSPPDVSFRVRCSTGTYVRAIARDLGEALGVGGHLTRLRRTGIGAFDVRDAIAVEDMERGAPLAGAWLTPLDAMAHLPRVEVDEAITTRLIHGQSPDIEEVSGSEGLDEGRPAVVVSRDELVCVGRREGDRLRPSKVFSSGLRGGE
ncbi:MAG: tRNA pseudouridine(55) synthase TruB [Gemmatimonadales bacterium]|nr:MAG: tRNA pseudouridine(55) synthase TruB [Gemmatimonadales bacterium]